MLEAFDAVSELEGGRGFFLHAKVLGFRQPTEHVFLTGESRITAEAASIVGALPELLGVFVSATGHYLQFGNVERGEYKLLLGSHGDRVHHETGNQVRSIANLVFGAGHTDHSHIIAEASILSPADITDFEPILVILDCAGTLSILLRALKLAAVAEFVYALALAFAGIIPIVAADEILSDDFVLSAIMDLIG